MVRLVFPVPLGALITVLPVDALTVNLLVFTAKLPVTAGVDCAVNAPVIMAVVETVRAPVTARVEPSKVRLALPSCVDAPDHVATWLSTPEPDTPPRAASVDHAGAADIAPFPVCVRIFSVAVVFPASLDNTFVADE